MSRLKKILLSVLVFIVVLAVDIVVVIFLITPNIPKPTSHIVSFLFGYFVIGIPAGLIIRKIIFD